MELSREIIWTKFYKSKLETDPDIQSKNYNRYIIFSLKNWIYLWSKDLLGEDISVVDNETPKENNIYITISFIIDEKTIKLSDENYNIISNKIENFDINKFNWFPIYSHKYNTSLDDGVIVSKLWIKQMLNFINLNPSYQTYIDADGLLINLSQNPDYIDLARMLLSSIRSKLSEMYKIGFIFKPDAKLISNWKLVPHDIKGGNRNYLSIDLTQDVDWNNQSIKTINYLTNYNERRDVPYDNLLYKAEWGNNQLIGDYKYMTDFLLSRMKGEITLNLKLDLNILDKHEI